MKVRIYYYHTDSSGVIYYGAYFSFLEEARTRHLEEKGVHLKELAKQGLLFVVGRQEIDYRAPVYYADTLEISTQISESSRVSMVFSHEIKNQLDQLVCEAKTLLVCVNSLLKPQSLKPFLNLISNR